MNRDIGNYCFIENNNVCLVYDLFRNKLYSPKNKADFYDLQIKLLDFIANKGVIKEVKDNKYLFFTKHFYNKINYFNSNKFLNERLTVSSKMTLMIAQDCNLRCKYCYGNEGKFGSIGEVMSVDTAEATVRFFVERSRPYKFKYLFISFLGGEPLINFPLMKHIIEFNKKEFQDIEFGYTFTTNATLFTEEIVHYIQNNNVSILVSLDGSKEIHDANRIYKNGKGTHDNVIKNLKLLKKYNVPFSIRATLPHEYFDKYEYITKYFTEIGAQQIFISRLSKYDPKTDVFDVNVFELEEDIKKTEYFHNQTHIRILQGENPKYVPFMKILENIHEANDSLISCGFMKGSTAISCNGLLYPCHRFVGMDGFDFGNIKDGIKKKRIKRIADNLDLATLNCNVCWARYLCKRGCIRDIAKDGGRFIGYDPKFCTLMKDSIEKALVMYYQITKYRPDYIKEFSNKTVNVYNIF